jgi:hypothetical protein
MAGMSELLPLSDIAASIVPNLVSVRDMGDASFIRLPLVFPSGAFVTVRLTHGRDGIRVSDSGFAYREAESFGATRSFAQTAKAIAKAHDVEVGRRSIFVDVHAEDVERAIFDVSAASHAVAERIVAKETGEAEVDISRTLHDRLDRVFSGAVEYDGKMTGASSTEWDVTAIARTDGHRAVFQMVSSHPASVYRTSTAFHDLAKLDRAPTLVSVVPDKSAMGPLFGLLTQAGKVIEVGQSEDAYRRAAA